MAQTRQLAAIMFTDIVGYTALMAKDEKKAFEVLKENLLIHESAIKGFHGNLVKELGDGILASFPTVSDALNAAISIQKQCKETGEFELSIGIHQGEVVLDKGDIFGDVVNVASRIRSLGSRGSVLFSDKVADEVKNKAEFKVVRLGRFELKNVAEPVEVFALGNDGFAVPKRSEIQGKLGRPGLAVSISIILVLMLAGYVTLNYEDLLPAGEEKSIVVLPFKNLSPDPKDQYLADGFHEEIINRLYLQENLLVIAAPSAKQADEAGWGPVEVGTKLNVQYLLSGSVQKDGDNLKITTHLTDARNGKVMNTKTLQRKLSHYFDLQGEVAIRVVRDVGITVSEGLGTYPKTTDNLKAWEYFKQSNNYPVNSTSKKVTDTLVYLLQKAVEEDSLFLQAWYGLQGFHFYKYNANGDSANLKAGLRAMEKIYSIDKDSYLAKNCEISYLYRVQRDYKEVIRKTDALLRIVPYNPQAISLKAFALRRMGMFQDCIDAHALAMRVNPLGRGTKREVAEDLVARSQTREARRYLRDIKNSALIADYYFFSFNSCVLEGRTGCLDSLLADADAETHELFGALKKQEIRAARNRIVSFYARDYASVLGYYTTRNAYDSAMLLRLLGDSLSSRSFLLKAMDRQKAIFNRESDSQDSKKARMNYFICKACLKETDWESDFAKMKVGLEPVFDSFYYNSYVMASLLAGQNDKALGLLKEWKTKNVCFPLLNGYVGPFQLLLKDHPLLDPLRNEPGFEELWEGNHLKLKPLKIPKELAPR